MKVVGLVVEYNPLHNGHLLHYQQSLKATHADYSVAVMSGNFLQRGEPALLGKWARTEMALGIGVDLVLELPTAYCTQNAEIFAFGAISTLHSLGIVDSVCFGSESGDISWVDSLAEALRDEPEEFKHQLKEYLSLGYPYPKAYASAISTLFNIPEKDMGQPNNILGLNYVLAIKRLHSTIKPATIMRTKAGYHQESITDERIASATAIRKIVMENSLKDILPYVPETTLDIVKREWNQKKGPVHWECFFPYLIHELTVRSIAELEEIYEMTEGLEYRLKEASQTAVSFHDFMMKIKTKRYTWNRLQRLLLYILLNVKKTEINSFQRMDGVPYIRVLGFNEKGRELLHEAKKRSLVPIITKLPKDRPSMLELDLRAASLYEIGMPTPWNEKRLNREFYRSPIRV